MSADGLRAVDGLARSLARPLAVVGREPTDETIARVFLGAIAEPGDGTMGNAIEALGAARVARLVHERASTGAFAEALAESGIVVEARVLAAAVERWLPRIDDAALVRSVEQAGRVGARLLLPSDDSWPVALDDLGAHAPLALWVRGDVGLLARARRTIALVGARAATGYGEHVAVESAAGLSDRGFTIVSGGAYGIDGAAHRATLRAGGSTVAFLAGGVDRFYPAGHEQLLSRIVETGAVVSELPCGQAPTKWRFLSRNRLIAASTAATVVLEAGYRSGSLNTAGHASELGRPLGAVPGPVTSPASAGCHRLLREFDAVCVTDAGQMAELALGTSFDGDLLDGFEASTAATAEGLRVLDALSARATRPVDDVARRAGLDPRTVRSVLGSLEAEGRAKRGFDGWVSVRRAT
ncbi:DNA-protecting protein DprA [Agromyces protaetiae]|uniref:DNA-protecting protein DprA n=1 Tax=Agromyces protaetiae TaxID=2509455 RepID=A0A4P6FD20_9MICO|nr:DNA-processing protein DprA [Agromyces protaetiae]QAY73804.1 DNA-protecting protein DprA [Agromyces protaetiae]